jgi:two-component system sensor histidine kinase TorS
MNARHRLAGALTVVFLCGPVFFALTDQPELVPVGVLSLLLIAGAWAALARERFVLACLLYMLGFDAGAFGYSWWLGRDSWVLLGLFTPLVLALPLLLDQRPLFRGIVVVSRVCVLAVASQMPHESMLANPPSAELLSVIRVGSVLMCSVMVSIGFLAYDRLARTRERALAASAEQLRNLVEKQARTEKQLQLSVWEADRADRARTAFLGAVSHELRTPLAMLLGLTEAMLEEAGSAKQSALVGDLEEMMIAERRLHDAVETLLEVAQQEESAQPSSQSSVPAARFLDEIAQGFSTEVASRKLDLQLVPIPGDVMVDRNRTMRVLRELIDNALRHADTTVRVTMARVERANSASLLHFTVTDDGPGLGALPQESNGDSGLHVRSTSSTMRPPKGIGLMLARRLVKQMNGSISLDHDRPAGTRISVYVPEGVTHKPRVLVVDDMRVNGEVLLRRLDELGAVGRWVGSGAEALDVLRAGLRFDLVLLDLHMPEMDGLEVTQLLRTLGTRCPDRIVAVTSDTSHEMKVKCAGVGLDEILPKPVSAAQLERALRGPQRTAPGLRPLQSQGAVDGAVLETLASELNDPSFVSEMVTWFAESAQARIQEGRRAAQDGDSETMHRAAHSLKGLAGTVGALKLQMLARDLELHAQLDTPGGGAGWREAEGELRAVVDSLSRKWLVEATA